MKTTKARKKFKNDFGQANHYLITTLVGLDSIYKGDIDKKPDEFSTSWNPISPKASAVRSRNFVLRSFLGSAVDAVDTYINNIFQENIFFHKGSPEQKIFDDNKRSIYKKSLLLGQHFKIDPVTIALLRVMITWRNHVMHSSADNTINKTDKNIILMNVAPLKNEYCGLLIDQSFFDKVETGADLTFKEVASLIKASHRYVQDFDEKVIQSIDIGLICFDYVKSTLSSSISFRTKYFARFGDKRKELVKSLLKSDIGIAESDFPKLEICYFIDKNEVPYIV